ncbi:MAG: hypothetical protein ABL907_22915, partial [Hyphomicrobium sp.]
MNIDRDLMVLMLTAVVCSAAVVTSYVLALAMSGHVAFEGLYGPVLRYWVGDRIGILVAVPFGLLALEKRLDFEPSKQRLL